MNEAEALKRARLKYSKDGFTLWRNNSGAHKDINGRYVKYGIASPGGSDLIGFRPLEITLDMVGTIIAQFCAIEVKGMAGKISLEQLAFIETITDAGGFARVVFPEDLI